MRNPSLPKIVTFFQNSGISQNSDTNFGLTKMSLLWVGTVYKALVFIYFPCFLKLYLCLFFLFRYPSNPVSIPIYLYKNCKIFDLSSFSQICRMKLFNRIWRFTLRLKNWKFFYQKQKIIKIAKFYCFNFWAWSLFSIFWAFDSLVNRLNNQNRPPVPQQMPQQPFPLFVTWKITSNGQLVHLDSIT